MPVRRTIFRDLTLVPVDGRISVARGDLVVENGRLAQVGGSASGNMWDEVIDGSALVAIPGFVQAHVHLTQTLFRNCADDLELLDWLKQRIWPMEAAHTEATNRASARLGLAELVNGGTTAILDMGTVRHHDAVFAAAEESGIRYTGGKTMMDVAADGVPEALRETTAASLEESAALATRWHGKAEGRLRYAYAPRFVISCTDELLRECAVRAKALGTPMHVHASENRGEVALVRERTKHGNLEWLEHLGVLQAHAAVAHCVHLDEGDAARLKAAGASAVHCPSSNLKLASGIAPVPALLAAGVNVALGADGAPCNNNLDALLEMRLATLIQKPLHGPRAMPAEQVLRLATMGGAIALGLQDQIGSLEAGKRADVTFLDLNALHSAPWTERDPIGAIVYSARPDNVKHVMVDGRFLKRDGALTRVDVREVLASARDAARAIGIP